jgi:hypothetical protein
MSSKSRCIYVRFQVLTATGMKMAVLWVVAPRSTVEVYRRFRGARFASIIKAIASEASVNIY